MKNEHDLTVYTVKVISEDAKYLEDILDDIDEVISYRKETE